MLGITHFLFCLISAIASEYLYFFSIIIYIKQIVALRETPAPQCINILLPFSDPSFINLFVLSKYLSNFCESESYIGIYK